MNRRPVVGPRGAVLMALLLGLAATGSARAYDIPPLWGCHWQELETVGGRIAYDVSDYPVGWIQGVENWDTALDWQMHFDYRSYPNGQTHLVWEEEEPFYFDCDAGNPHFLYACWRPVDLADCDDNILSAAAINFRRSSYTPLGPVERTAVSAHEWGHNLDLGHTDGYFCDDPHRIMAEDGPDGENCITGPTPPELYTVADLYGRSSVDTDGDDFADSVELYLGTAMADDCPDGTWDDAWPPDFDNNKAVDVTDALTFLAKFPSAVTNPGDERYDFVPDGAIDVSDALLFLSYFPSGCA